MAAKKKTPTNPLDRVLSQYKEKISISGGGGGGVRAGDLSKLGLLDFMVAASPHLVKPLHLGPVIPYLLECERKPQFFAFSAPPQHGKSYLVNHFVAWMMIRHPGIRVAYGSYGEALSFTFSRLVKDILVDNGYELNRAHNSTAEWELANGALFKAVSPGGDFTGRGADLIIIDDPFKNRVTASSGAVRESTWNWFTGVALTRRSRDCSVIVTHTRWNADDVIGRLVSKLDKPFINIPAINEDGTALWPDFKPLSFLASARNESGEHDWASLYMGQPRPLGGAVFNDFETYSNLEFDALIEEKKLLRFVIGIDCAYTKKAHADYSVAVVLAIMTNGKSYIVDVRRAQTDVTSFSKTLKELRMAYDNASIYWYVGGQEKVIAEFFRNNCGVPIKDLPAKEDKFARAQSVAAAWNSGRVLMPSDHKPWADKFLAEVQVFSGLDDPQDDQVDALAAAWIPNSKPTLPRGMAQTPIIPW